jgi:hypothetical protein
VQTEATADIAIMGGAALAAPTVLPRLSSVPEVSSASRSPDTSILIDPIDFAVRAAVIRGGSFENAGSHRGVRSAGAHPEVAIFGRLLTLEADTPTK